MLAGLELTPTAPLDDWQKRSRRPSALPFTVGQAQARVRMSTALTPKPGAGSHYQPRGAARTLRGRDTWRQGAELIKRAFPDLHARIEDVVAADDRVVVRLTMHGTHSGDYLGFPPTGRPVSYVSHEFYRVTDGLIAEE